MSEDFGALASQKQIDSAPDIDTVIDAVHAFLAEMGEDRLAHLPQWCRYAGPLERAADVAEYAYTVASRQHEGAENAGDAIAALVDVLRAATMRIARLQALARHEHDSLRRSAAPATGGTPRAASRARSSSNR
jgi:hypothetical protein